MAIRVAINGFGRIGRSFFRAAAKSAEIEIVAINDLADAETLAHLLKFDSVHGRFDQPVDADCDALTVNGLRIPVLNVNDPAKLPWAIYRVDIVVEATGCFTDRSQAQKHLDAGAKRVVISAPGQGADITVCMGINESDYQSDQHRIVSNASCTTNCLAPVAKVLLEKFGIVKGMMNTVHSYTNGQSIHDLPNKDLRRGRAAGESLIPTTTGAAKAVALVLPELENKLSGMAVRVPVPNVSLIDLVVETKHSTTASEVNSALKSAADGPLKGVMSYCDLPLVSRDYLGDPSSATVDSLSTSVMEGNMVRVIAWYDNEWGYSNRLTDLVEYIAAMEQARETHLKAVAMVRGRRWEDDCRLHSCG